ncbi:MAG: CDP-glycerol glycerophosphotransferase family protein [Clostridia bacterium]|nr:CDP-glycerol glycerophosphotransferase family protein [Clostridia bacterium]
MKLLIVKVFVLFIRVLYAPMKLRKTKNKIVWLSRQSDEKSEDIKRLSDMIKKLSPETIQVFRLKRLKDESGLSLSYVFSIFVDMWELSDASIAVADTYSIPLSCLNHKNTLKKIQIWHALGAVKKFSLQSVGKAQGRNEAVSRAMCMHKNYDVVIAPSEATAKFYCEAFGCTEDKIRMASLPRVDEILNGDCRKAEFINNNPDFENKKIILYVPTFRTNDDVYAERLHDAFSETDGIKIVVKAHPLSKLSQNPKYQINGDFSTYDLMKIADGIITDYSACAFEGSLLNKPMWFYVPDYEIYKAEQGLNVDVLSELPSVSFTDEKMLIKDILSDNYDLSLIEHFSDKYVKNKNADNTEMLARIILE